MILHVPHSSTKCPTGINFPKTDITNMTDWYTDELFNYPCEKIVFPYTRLYCDVERFLEDEMDCIGMGICYTKRYDGTPLRKVSDAEKKHIIDNYYLPHHEKFRKAVEYELEKYGKALIVDAHSFPKRPLPYERDTLRPDICVGTGKNTPMSVKTLAIGYFTDEGYKVAENRPFCGSIVPLEYIGDERVVSVMIEVNRGLYLAERRKTEGFSKVKTDISDFLYKLKNEVFG